MYPSSAMALVSAGVRSAARALVSVRLAASAAARRLRLRAIFIVRFLLVDLFVELVFHLLRRRRGPLAFYGFLLRPVETHGHHKRTLRRGQPVGFLVLAGGFVLDKQGQSAVGIALELRQHRRAEELSIVRVGDVEALRQIIQ